MCQAACIIAQRGCLEFAFAVFTGHVICVERAGTKSNNVPATMMYLPVQGYIWRRQSYDKDYIYAPEKCVSLKTASRRIAVVGEQLCAKIVNDTVATVNHNANVVMRSYCAQSLEINK